MSVTNPMLSTSAAAASGRDNNRTGRDNHRGATVRAASAIGSAMEAGAATTCYFDDGRRRLIERKRHSLNGTHRQSDAESNSDELFHAFPRYLPPLDIMHQATTNCNCCGVVTVYDC